jgi:hypothetical protein
MQLSLISKISKNWLIDEQWPIYSEITDAWNWRNSSKIDEIGPFNDLHAKKERINGSWELLMNIFLGHVWETQSYSSVWENNKRELA